MSGIKENLRGIKTFMEQMESFFELAASAFGAPAAEEGAEGEEKEKKSPLAGADNGGFKPPDDMIKMGGGGAPNPHPIDPEMLGKFTFAEFGSEKEMFDYV